jgi:AcrR family transcriptional regulator
MMNERFSYCERMVQDSIERLDPVRILEFESAGLLTATFRRLDPERQQVVVAAILDEAFERGPSRLRLKQVAEAAGISVGSLYLYFGDRQGVLDFATAFAAQTLADELRGYVGLLAELPLAEGLHGWVSGGLEWSASQAAVMRYFARAAYEGDPVLSERLVAPIAEAMLDAITAMVAAAQERGELREGLDVATTATAVHLALATAADALMIPHLAGYLLPGRAEVSPEQTLGAVVDLVVRGLR